LFMSVGEIHNGLDRAARAGLFDAVGRKPRKQALEEFLVHGIKYAFFVEHGGVTRGVPTAYAAPPLNDIIVADDNDYPPVWSDVEGTVRGYAIEPLYPGAPRAARIDKEFYELLALVDAIRAGRARERNIAVDRLGEHLRRSYA
jgi:hypothetical protein